MTEPREIEEIAKAIWREDHYDPKLCSHSGEGGDSCAYCEPHDDDTPDNWPADKERALRQARAAYQVMASSDGWLPIESAPKDGRRILITGGTFTDDEDWCDMAHGLGPSVVIVQWVAGLYNGWQGEKQAHDQYRWHRPILWRPLPDPPVHGSTT